MFDIVGNIKVDESKPERIAYLLSCIRSYQFLKQHAGFYLNLDNPSAILYGLVRTELERSGFTYVLTTSKHSCYGETYSYLLAGITNDFSDKQPGLRYEDMHFVINFMEDQFMLTDDFDQLIYTLNTMKKHSVDICISGFWQVEQNSAQGLEEFITTPAGIIYENTMENYTAYRRFYGSKYYIGVNFITTHEFAKKFWARDLGPRPHEYEVSFYDKDMLHTVMVPRMEIQVAIDDDHGAEASCMLKRNEPKWERIFQEIGSEYSGLIRAINNK